MAGAHDDATGHGHSSAARDREESVAGPDPGRVRAGPVRRKARRAPAPPSRTPPVPAAVRIPEAAAVVVAAVRRVAGRGGDPVDAGGVAAAGARDPGHGPRVPPRAHSLPARRRSHRRREMGRTRRARMVRSRRGVLRGGARNVRSGSGGVDRAIAPHRGTRSFPSRPGRSSSRARHGIGRCARPGVMPARSVVILGAVPALGAGSGARPYGRRPPAAGGGFRFCEDNKVPASCGWAGGDRRSRFRPGPMKGVIDGDPVPG